MFEDVFEKLTEKYQHETTIKKQGVSIGLTFDEEDEINIDVVPARETSQDSFPVEKNLNYIKHKVMDILKPIFMLKLNTLKPKKMKEKLFAC
ncbi:Uncharacterised protein [Pasteurella canis]|uniref:Uncharacterized protein n=1 Tax=Pasteurella canis TaxID=753 RepID=A0A379ERL0_9PAST|nr:hypothetical protein [Pasteurella canis]SUC03278.1 Uncharacterised protein [Pasteurella canis]